MSAVRSISVLGLGQMGSAIARAYLKTGLKTTVWNRSSGKTEPLVSQGAVGATSAAECVSASRLVITCFLDHKALREAFANVKPGPDNGITVVDFTSGTPDEVQRTQQMMGNLHIPGYIRGIVYTTPPYVGTPGTSLYYSGNPEAFTMVQDGLNVLGKPRYLGEDPSSATTYETILVNTLIGLSAGFLQSMEVLKKSNLDYPGGAEGFVSEALVPLLSHEYSRMLQDYARQIDQKKYTSSKGARLGLLVHSFESLMQYHSGLCLDSLVLAPLQELVKTRIAQGGIEDELSSLVEIISDDNVPSSKEQKRSS